MKDDVIRVRVQKELKERLNRVAEARGCDAADVTREALIEKVNADEKRLNLTTVEG